MARRQTHDVTPRETLDLVVFIVAFVLGAVGGLFLKILGAHPLLTAGYAVLILILYAIATWAGGRIKIEPETIGDNCYYLGFLFTLASLAFTLYQMSDPTTNGGRLVAIPEVISGFGVALSSTIVGVFLRVLLMQFRPDFVAKDREVRAEINRAFMDFRKNMSGMLSQMKGYAAESVQLASERDERLRKSTEKFTEDHQEALKTSANFLSSHMKEVFTEAAQTAVRDISKAMTDSSKAQQAQMTVTLTELENLKARLSEQEAESLEEIQQRRKRLLAEIEVQEALKTSANFLSSHMKEVFTEAVQTAVRDISKDMTEGSKAQQAQMTVTLTELENLKARLSEQEAESFEEIQQRRKRLLAELEVAERQIQAHNEAMDQYIKITRISADAMTKRILPAIDALQEKINNMPPRDGPYFTEEEVKNPPEPQVEKIVVLEPRKRSPWSWLKRREGSE